MVESRFKRGQRVWCVDVNETYGGAGQRLELGAEYKVQYPEQDGVWLEGVPVWIDGRRLSSTPPPRRDWIDPNEWAPDFTRPLNRPNLPVYPFHAYDAVAWGFFCGWAASHATFAVGSGSWKKPVELVAVMLPRKSVEWWAEHLADFPTSKPVLHAACRAALDAEASR